jgi:16S rRNA (cytidine1402-2'-O)-methyltransferase
MACATPPEDTSSSSAPPPGPGAAEARSGDDSAQAEGGAPSNAPRLFRPDPDLEAGLYIVSTPIGNLRDITLRALDVLASADLICAEDTRVAMKLLNAYGVSSKVRPYHDHNGAQARPGLIRELQGGARIALISDAGTPLVSDPGFKLVREAAAAGVKVIAIPGASAPLAALTASGLPTDRFVFAGFPPPKSAARKRFLGELKAIAGTLVFFEGPSRLAEALADMAEVFGDREAVVARELTKLFEEVRRGRLGALAAAYGESGPPRGELVVLVGPPLGDAEIDEADLEAAMRAADPALPLKEQAAAIAERFGLKRRDVYNRMLEMRDQGGEEEGGDAGE